MWKSIHVVATSVHDAASGESAVDGNADASHEPDVAAKAGPIGSLRAAYQLI